MGETCEQRIGKALASRVEDFQAILTRQHRAALVEDLERLEANEREWWEYPLAVEQVKTYRIELSYGGPQDYLQVTVSEEDGDIRTITYHYLDWYDGAVTTVTGSDFQTISEWVQPFIEGR